VGTDRNAWVGWQLSSQNYRSLLEMLKQKTTVQIMLFSLLNIEIYTVASCTTNTATYVLHVGFAEIWIELSLRSARYICRAFEKRTMLVNYKQCTLADERRQQM